MCHFLAPAGHPEMMHKNFMHRHFRIFVVQRSCMKFCARKQVLALLGQPAGQTLRGRCVRAVRPGGASGQVFIDIAMVFPII